MKTPKDLEEAVKNYQSGEKDCFERLYQLSYPYLYTCMIHVVKDEEAAKDMLQETYLEISRSIAQLKNTEDFLSWASTIGNRKCYAFLKKQKDVLVRADNFAESGKTALDKGNNRQPVRYAAALCNRILLQGTDL